MNIEILIDKILSELGLSYSDTLSKNSHILCVDAIYALIIEDSIKESADYLEVSEDILEQVLRRHFKVYCNKDSNTKWGTFLLSLIEYKKCASCKNILNYSSFGKDISKYHNLSSRCKSCESVRAKKYRELNTEAVKERISIHYYSNKSYYLAKNANRRALKLKAIASWANIQKIKEIYKNCPEGYHVDHIIPLQGELVCGLHVENNLQYLSAKDNLQKGNKYGE